MPAMVRSVLFTASIAMSAAFVGSAYVPGLGFVAGILSPFVWGVSLMYGFAGGFSLLMSKVAKVTVDASVFKLAPERRPILDETVRHDPEYALGMVMAIMLAVSIAMTERYWLPACYLAAFVLFRYGIRSLKERANAVLSAARAASAKEVCDPGVP